MAKTKTRTRLTSRGEPTVMRCFYCNGRRQKRAALGIVLKCYICGGEGALTRERAEMLRAEAHKEIAKLRQQIAKYEELIPRLDAALATAD